MKITDLTISPSSLGGKFWLTDVIPSYEYKDNRRTDTITGYKYSICLVEKGLEKINVRIDGKKLMEKPETYAEVSFSGLEVFIYWLNGKPEVGAKAANIALVNNKS